MSVGPGGSDRHRLHWETALDHLELEALQAERLLEDHDRPAPEPWVEPDLRGPVPADLVGRALEIRARQARVESQLATTLGAVARQHEFTSRVDRATRARGPAVYLDVSA